jgi:NAD(P)H-dependent FMN reductase
MEKKMSLNVAVFYGSARHHRQGIKAAKYVVKQSEKRGYKVDLIEPFSYDLPLLDKMYKEYKPVEAPETLQKMAEIIKNADGFIIVSGEYNHSIPPGLSNLLDHFLEEYLFRPSAIVTYSAGYFGGVRAAMQLRAMLAELGMPSISSIFPVPKIGNAFDEEGNDLTGNFDKRIGRFLDEFEWYAEALKEARKKGVPF